MSERESVTAEHVNAVEEVLNKYLETVRFFGMTDLTSLQAMRDELAQLLADRDGAPIRAFVVSATSVPLPKTANTHMVDVTFRFETRTEHVGEIDALVSDVRPVSLTIRRTS